MDRISSVPDTISRKFAARWAEAVKFGGLNREYSIEISGYSVPDLQGVCRKLKNEHPTFSFKATRVLNGVKFKGITVSFRQIATKIDIAT